MLRCAWRAGSGRGEAGRQPACAAKFLDIGVVEIAGGGSPGWGCDLLEGIGRPEPGTLQGLEAWPGGRGQGDVVGVWCTWLGVCRGVVGGAGVLTSQPWKESDRCAHVRGCMWISSKDSVAIKSMYPPSSAAVGREGRQVWHGEFVNGLTPRMVSDSCFHCCACVTACRCHCLFFFPHVSTKSLNVSSCLM